MKKLLVLGAGFLQKFVIEKAVSMGYYVYAIDKNPDSVGFAAANESAVIDIVDKEECLKYAIEKNVDGVMTAATDFGVISAAYIAEKMGLKGVNYETANIFKNKYAARKLVSQKKIDCVHQFYEILSKEDVPKLRNCAQFPLMVKPCDGSGSKGTMRVDNFGELETAVNIAMENSLSHKVIAEDFVQGKEYGAEFLVIDGEPHLLAIMEKDMTEPPIYSELGHTIPSGVDCEEEINSTVSDVLKAINVNFGAVNTDIIVTNDGKVCVVDIGARMGGNLIGSHIIPIGTGINYLECLIKATMGDDFDLRPQGGEKPVSTRILALSSGIVKQLPDFKKIEEDFDVKIYHHLSIGDEIRQYKTNLDGCGYVVASADNVSEARRKAYSAYKFIDNSIVRE